MSLRSLLFLLVLVGTVHAQYIFEGYSITMDIRGNTIHEKIDFNIKNLGDSYIDQIEYAFSGSLANLHVYADGKEVQSYHQDNTIVIQLPTPLGINKTEEVRIEFDSSEFISEFRGNRILTFSFIPEAPTRNFTLWVLLPEGSTLSTEINANGGRAAVYPVPDKILSDGKRIILKWYRHELTPKDSLRIFVMYSQERASRGYLLAIPAFALGTALGYLIAGRKSRKIAKMVLTQDENLIYEILLREGGEILQEKLVRETGFSKAKVSKLVRNLEVKGIIKKEPYGKTNRIMLNREFRGGF